MLSYLTAFRHWLTFRLYYYLLFCRPASLQIHGKIHFDRFSFLAITGKSRVSLGAGLMLQQSRLYVDQATCTLGPNSVLRQSILVVRASQFETGQGAKLIQKEVHCVNQSTFRSGDFVQLSGVGSSRSFFMNGSFAEWGTNVNVFAKVQCDQSHFSIGDHVFINEGTEIRCHNTIKMGSYIMVSYDCRLFDTNTHSTEAEWRRREINDGFPNSTIQQDSVKAQIKTAPIIIGDDVWIGTRAILFRGTKLADQVIVGAASVVAGLDVPAGKKVVGNPGKIMDH